ncbi:MAG: carboxypeptidase regulatory-like domain-containing protein [Acidimicrobiales bacterium]|nr:carboxypeptidase regulatory-like domain-containing protein [Acidimicrobiales bacterium]
MAYAAASVAVVVATLPVTVGAGTNEPPPALISTWSDTVDLFWPLGIAAAGDGSVYVADTNNNRVLRYSAAQALEDQWGTLGSGAEELDRPVDVAVAPSGDVYVVDQDNDRIKRFTAEGDYVSQFATGATHVGEVSSPDGIDVAPDGTVWVADGRVWHHSATGALLGGWEDGLDEPDDVAVAPDGDVVVGGGGELRRYSPQGVSLAAWEASAGRITVEPRGTIAVTTGASMDRYTPEGELVSSTVLGDATAVAATPDGRLLALAERPFSHTVLEYQPATADLVQVVLRADRRTASPPERIRYTLTVRNPGTTGLTGVTVTDTTVPRCAGPIGSLAAGAVHEVTCSHVADPADSPSFVHTATVDSDQTASVESNAVAVAVSGVRTPRSFNEWEVRPGAGGIDVDPGGAVLVSREAWPTGAPSVAVHDLSGTVTSSWDLDQSGESGAGPLEVTDGGDVLTSGRRADPGGPCVPASLAVTRCPVVDRYSPSGTLLDSFDANGRGYGEMAAAADGRTYVVEHPETHSDGIGNVTIGTAGVGRFEADGTRSGSFPTDGHVPDGIAASGTTLYLTFPSLDEVRAYSTSGTLLGTLTGEDPTSVDVDVAGNVYVAWSGDDRLSVYSPAGTQLGTVETPVDELAAAPGGSVYALAAHPVEGVGIDETVHIRHYSFAIAGTVTEDDSGDRLPGVWTVAIDEQGHLADGAVTGADGSYRLVLPPGRYKLQFVAPDGEHLGEWFDDVVLGDPDSSPWVTAGAATATADASLAPTPRFGTLAGTISSEGGGALAGAWVAVIDLDHGGPVAGAVTDVDGGYSISGLPPADYLVAVIDPGGAHRVEYHADATNPADAGLVAVSAGDTATVDESLAAVAPAGTGAGLGGTVTASGGGPVSDAWVAVVGTDGQFAGGAVTDETGAWSLAVAPGNYRTFVIDPTGGHRAEWFDDQPDFASADAVAIGPGATGTADVELAADGATGAVGGTLTDQGSGEPVPRGWVAVIDSTGTLVGSDLTDADGHYLVDGLRTGSYVVGFVDTLGLHAYEFFADAAWFGDADPVAVTAGTTSTADAALARPDPLGFVDPWGVAAASDGDVYVADTGNDRITRTGANPLAFGRSGSGPGQLDGPTDVAVAGDGSIWVADTGNSRIQHFSATGVHLGGFGAPGSGNGEFDRPHGVAVNPLGGGIWVADTGNDRIQWFSSDGTWLGAWGTTGSGLGQFDKPYDVDVVPAGLGNLGTVYVADGGSNDRIARFGQSGQPMGYVGGPGSGLGQFQEPSGVEVDGLIWVTDDAPAGSPDRVQGFGIADRALKIVFGTEGTGPGQFDELGGVAVDADGSLWVVDSGVNDRVSAFTPVGGFLGSLAAPF